MVIADTSVWVDHLRRGDPRLQGLLEQGLVAIHPFVIGEIACGNLANRKRLLRLLADLPQAPVAEHGEAMLFVEMHALHGRGIGWVDAHLLASTALQPGSLLWTRDKRLHALAQEHAIAYATMH